ncbi:hypothetical protein COCON_G00165250 [Conger conger]|uniref:CBM21 domain-containing protein n=1 Tax=Conger conger TaxID=82655 RepID=A0A9Q1D6M1_CONCO|nr:protein phosphatase 1 regulatory subunit 3C-B-like [Conger conger]KAJ8260802.1 hypothetical protein COCON_G00165250 [Conger conger]
MDGTKVLHAMGGHSLRPPVSPLDLSPPLCMSQSPPLLRLWPSLSSPKLSPRCFSHLLSPPSSPDSPMSRSPVFSRKKRVVFADAKGLALTTVRYFSEGEEEEEEEKPRSPAPAETPPGVARMPGPGGAIQAAEKKTLQFRPPVRRGRPLRLWLGFPQPAADPGAFRLRLQEELVLLESCRVTTDSLSGAVCARKLGFETAVHVRVTFDSWRSHRDVPCAPHKHMPAAGDTNLFTFDIPLPENLDPRERLEFCVSCRHGKGALLWDKNKGQNYRVHASAESETPAASLLASHRSSLIIHAKRKGLWDSLPQGRSDTLAGPHSPHGRKTGTDWRPITPPGSPGIGTHLGPVGVRGQRARTDSDSRADVDLLLEGN